MGSGKTATGSALAELLGWEFVDLDEEIERRAASPDSTAVSGAGRDGVSGD